MRFATLSIIVLAAAFALWSPQSSAKEEVYRWVDEDGVVHFGDRAPQQANAEKIVLPSSPPPAPADSATANPVQAPDPQPPTAKQARDASEEQRLLQEVKTEVTAESCDTARFVASQLEPSPRVNVTHEDGTVTRMDDNERLEKLAEAKAFITEYCDK